MRILESIGAATWINGFKPVNCTHQPCSRWLTQRYLEVRRAGVTMDGLWYCSYGCFRAAAEARVARLLLNSSSSPDRAPRMPLGLTLVNRGLLTTEQYKAAAERTEPGEDLGDALLRLGLLTEKQITSVRAAQWGCAVFSQSSGMSALDAHIPPALMDLCSMVPLHYVPSMRKLLVGFVYRIEYGPLYAVEQVLDCSAQACFLTPAEFRAKRREQQTFDTPEELKFASRLRPTEITRTVCDYGALLDADEVVMQRCRDFLWVRLKGRPRATDLLFRLTADVRPNLRQTGDQVEPPVVQADR